MEGLNILKSSRFNQDMLLGVYEHYRKYSVHGKYMNENEQEEILKYSIREVQDFPFKVPVNRRSKDFISILFNLNKIMDKLEIKDKDRYLIIMLKNTNETTFLDIYHFLKENFPKIRTLPETWEVMILLRKMFIGGSIFCPVF